MNCVTVLFAGTHPMSSEKPLTTPCIKRTINRAPLMQVVFWTQNYTHDVWRFIGPPITEGWFYFLCVVAMTARVMQISSRLERSSYPQDPAALMLRVVDHLTLPFLMPRNQAFASKPHKPLITSLSHPRSADLRFAIIRFWVESLDSTKMGLSILARRGPPVVFLLAHVTASNCRYP